MPKIIIFTQTYNSEKFLRRTIESVLNQTYRDFVYMITDNASTDKTREIIQEYAQKDKRIIATFEDTNDRSRFVDNALECAKNYTDGYWCLLDHDDEYDPEFFGKTLKFAKKYNLDIAGAGTQFYSGETGEIFDGAGYTTRNDFVIRGDGFKDLNLYMSAAHVVWNKLFSLSVLRKCNNDAKKAVIGVDTIFTYGAFAHANAVGQMAGALHKYYVMPESWSTQFDSRRIESNSLMLSHMLDFLDKRKIDTVENRDSLYAGAYLIAIEHSFKTIVKTELSLAEKIIYIKEIFALQHTQNAYMYDLAKIKLLSIQQQMQEYLSFAVLDTPDVDGFENMVDIYSNMHDIYTLPTWRPKDILSFLLEVRKKCFDKKIDAKYVNKLIEKRYPQDVERAISLIEQGRRYEGFSYFAKIYQIADLEAKEDIIVMLNNIFREKKVENLVDNYEKNSELLESYPYYFGKKAPDIDGLTMWIFPVSENVYFIYDENTDEFMEIEVNSENETEHFFKDLSKPLLIRNETNLSNLEFLMDNVRASEDVAMDNHIYLHYENPDMLFCLMQITNLFTKDTCKKFVYLVGDDSQYQIDFKKDFDIDYSARVKKDIGVNDIKRLFLGYPIIGFSGVTYQTQILDDHPDIISTPYTILEHFVFFYRDIKGVTKKDLDELFKKFDQIPNENFFKKEIIRILTHNRSLSPKELDAQVKRYFKIVAEVMKEADELTPANWLKAILLAFSMYRGQKFGKNRIAPAVYYTPHFHIETDENQKNFYNELGASFKYCKVLVNVRDPIAVTASLVGWAIKGHMWPPTAKCIDYYIINCNGHFRKKDDFVYRKGMLVRFEDLKLNPRATLESLIEFLNIPYSDRLEVTTENGEPCGVKWSANGDKEDGQTITTVYNAIEKEEFLSEYDKYRIEMLLGKYYSHFGYKPKFYDSKVYTTEEIVDMMKEPLLCDILDIKNNLSTEEQIRGRRIVSASLWEFKASRPTPNTVDKGYIPMKLLIPKKKLLKRKLYE